MKTRHLLLIFAGMLMASHTVAANTIYVTPYIGYTFSSSIKDDNGVNIEPENDPHYAISIETDLDKGRVGLFVSHQPTDYETFSNSGSFTYVHFQSSLRFDTFERFDTFVGASIGTTIIDADWSDQDLVFSGGFLGGVEYKFTPHFSLLLEGRWLANLMESDTTTVCNLPEGNQTCNIKVNSEWLTQFQTNLGFTYAF
ncbi:porin family protein [Photobacterium sp. DNB23_23_1]|uniref:Porin family protein n=1 Tax=Photobacterium pectinilyticum TaxID=2906793 RepID=A0ABT1N1W3_9GAMM|nr:porin family protein [Photobacterium sp. ZSDE20]MCQ1058705.1 porin family protein [Photobacterium sp. ZSDE20]MDD1823486.1 porin family protein [Photobacterium sp. ZSDE20]